jgi:hypothetical protein
MDENRLKKIIQTLLNNSYSGTTITEFRALPTSKWDEDKSDWVPDSYGLFLGVKCNGFYPHTRGMEDLVESVIGFETCIDIL